MRILLIEDDAETARYIVTGLTREGFSVDCADNGVDGLHLATDSPPDLMIIDRMLPRLDGVSLLKASRSAGVKAPVIVLTALGAVEDRVEGIEAGADDYLVKPFAFSELRARVNALLRRPPLREEKSKLAVGDIHLDRFGRCVSRNGHEIKLQAREFQLLEFLMLNEGRVVTRTMLLEEIWGFRFDPGSNIVESHISRLRAKMGGGKALIATVRGAGYVIKTG
ncbi:MAG: response regulator transcription factor [Rhodospirillaceae bacterium]|nr:response regulator transcription factor [Rhodospirillaceae bacterium]